MFSGDAIAVENILRVMCFSRDPKLWNIHVQDLEHNKNLCEEPLPLNRSGETPLEVARQAGHYEEIRQVYENLGLPTTIKDQLWLARCADVMKNIIEKRKEREEKRLLSDWSSVMGPSDKDSDEVSNEDVSVFFSRRCKYISTTLCRIDRDLQVSY